MQGNVGGRQAQPRVNVTLQAVRQQETKCLVMSQKKKTCYREINGSLYRLVIDQSTMFM